jgi:hypothetical protein
MKQLGIIFFAAFIIIPFLGGIGMASEKIKLTSPAFKEGEMIPKKYTYKGKNISPPLYWEHIPEKAKSLALICEDPDAPDPKAPKMVFVHWVIFNIMPTEKGLPQGVVTEEILQSGAIQGKSDYGHIGYGGPNPPIGIHRYFFTLYALDIKLDLHSGCTKRELLKAMKGHILGEGKLMGTYGK